MWDAMRERVTLDDLLCGEADDDWEDARLPVVVAFLMNMMDQGGVPSRDVR